MKKLGVLLLLAWLAPLCAAESAPFAWQVRAPGNPVTHYLLGSLHVLSSAEYPLPVALQQAYTDTRRLVLESDLDALQAPELQTQLWDAAQQAPHTPAALSARARVPLAHWGLPQAMCDIVQSWYCALMLELTAFERAGFTAEYGLDRYFYQRAKQDRRTIVTLESAAEQIGFLTRMPAVAAEQLLASTLDDIGDGKTVAVDLVALWRRGDVAALSAQVMAMQQHHPRAYAHLLGQRNAAWRAPLARWFADALPTLVVVGAAHLVGDDGLLAQLRAQGFAVTAVAP